MSLSPGTRLGPYEIVAPLGAGGMGEVYRARDTRLGRDVAVKVLPQHLTENADNRARFEREAKTVSSLNHPNICTLFDVGREAGVDYLVMELIEGETLAHRLARGPLPLDQVLAIGAQIADAISRAHRAGIVHRDLKPGNVMLTKSGAKLMDFGLARATGTAGGTGGVSTNSLTQSPTVAEPLTAQGTIVGTYQYMAPEQLEGRETDERSDVWALGCVLYEMATGKRAFVGKSQASLIAAILEHAPPPIAEIQPTSPPALDRLIRACLAKDPDDRLQTAHDVKLQLQWIAADPAGSSPSAPAVAVRPRRSRIGPGIAALGAIVAVAVLAFAAGRHMAAPAETASSVFEQRTFRTQSIFSARFMPDGKTTVLSAALDGNRTELFVIRPGYPEPQPLGKMDMHLLAVSSHGELLVLTHARYTGHHRLFTGTLARMPLEGAAPRELMEDVREADWAPDGETLAVIHDVGGTDRLEYPVGTVLHTSAGYLSDPRVSPDGSLVAFMEHPSRFDDRGSVKVVDRSGKVREVSGGYWGLEGMAWAPNGKALYYSGGKSGAMYEVYRTALDGDARVVSENAGVMTLQDVAKDGTWAVTRDDAPLHLLFRAAGSETDVDLSWLDGALGPVLSPDGKSLVFTDQSSFAGANYEVAMRPTSGGGIVRLGEGTASDISADGKSVLVGVPSTPPRVMVYPMGVGQAVQLDRGQFENVSDARWLPGGKSVLVSGNLPGGPARAFLLDPATHEAKPVGSEGIWNCIPSPDGTTFIARTKAGWAVYPSEGTGVGMPVSALTSKDYLIRWNPNGSAVFVFQRGEIPAPVERVDLATGKRQTVTTLSEGHSAGRVSVLGVSMADDLRTVAYAAWDYSSILFTATRTSGTDR